MTEYINFLNEALWLMDESLITGYNRLIIYLFKTIFEVQEKFKPGNVVE